LSIAAKLANLGSEYLFSFAARLIRSGMEAYEGYDSVHALATELGYEVVDES